MDNIFVDKTQVAASSSTAFFIYRPRSKITEEMVFYTKEAWQIFSLSVPSSKKGSLSFSDICFLCSKWKGLFEKCGDDPTESGERYDSEVHFIELLKSDRRLYTVRGLVLSGHQNDLQKQGTHLMFILERILPDRVNFPLISRQWKLNNREQDIVRFLLEERSNKEIAHALGLSLNTIKGYMKLLMRKLGVASRTGIITCLLTKRNPSSVLPKQLNSKGIKEGISLII